ncbi:MAG: synthase gamma chain [Pseudomonadota bacterium]|jgi:F-type H+-transporting ATPase subunit gamma
MSFAQEIRGKISSIKGTQKITRAMEMVAASKMRKAQERMTLSRPYAHKMLDLIGHVASSHAEYQHPYLQVRDIKRAGFLIITTDKGLCGGLNTNLLKLVLQEFQACQSKGIEIDLAIIGGKGEAFFKRVGGHIVAHAHHLGDAPQLQDLIGVVKALLDAYKQGQLDSLNIIYNEFVNTMTQKARSLSLLPILPVKKSGLDYRWDYLYEPDAKYLLELVLTRYIESQVYQSVVENTACEQAARMVAMKSATDNAGELISDLQLAYNKARQAAITKELAEIVAGAEAV